MTHCSHCHQCGAKLRTVVDGEEWCPKCQTYRRYPSHGWVYAFPSSEDKTLCPETSKSSKDNHAPQG